MDDWNTLRERMQGATTYLELATVKDAFDRFVESRRREKAHVELTLAAEEGAKYVRVQRSDAGDTAGEIAILLEGTTFVLTLRLGATAARTLVEQLQAATGGTASDAVNAVHAEPIAAPVDEVAHRQGWEGVAPQ